MKVKFLPVLSAAALAFVLVAAIACGADEDDEAAAAPTAAAAAPTTVAAAPTAAAATPPPAAQASDIQRGGTFTVGTTQQITTVDGHSVGPLNNRNAWDGFLAPYVKFKPDGLVGPHLLKSWETSADLTTYTFTVQEGVKFHTGRPLEAEDLRFSTQRAIDLESSWSSGLFGIQSIEVLGPLSLRITNDKASSVFPDQFERHYLVAKDNVSNAQGGTAGTEDDFSNPIGPGPFKFVEYVPGEKVTMTRFDDYWKMGEDGKALPYLDGVVVRTIPDSTALFAALKTGEVHAYWQLPAKLADTLEGDPNARSVPTAFSTQHFYMVLEHQRTTGDNVFADIRARRALLLALDKDELAAVGFGDSGTPLWTNQMIPSDLPFGPSGFPEIRQDKEESKRLFAELGITELHFVFWDSGFADAVLAVIERQMKDVGVTAILHKERVADWSCAMGRGGCGPDWKWTNMVSTNGAANPPEPSLHIAQRWLCPGVDSMGKWCNEEMDALALAATQTTDNEERARLYREWNEIFIEQIPAISWVQVQDWHGEHKSVNNLEDLYLVLWYEAVWLSQ
jgi:peptide/nickel transport system substrate-binding protein